MESSVSLACLPDEQVEMQKIRSRKYWKADLKLLKYVYRTINYGLVFSAKSILPDDRKQNLQILC